MFRKIKGNEVIGKCPKCEADLTKDDIDMYAIVRKPGFLTYTCVKCKFIIGFALGRL
ncbi:MAG: hypothetical protein HWN67_08850 [Candidatus Helarchaeota archaeon]|nr:hypothetical protein [Candidatus Helarchaeota archaeon]